MAEAGSISGALTGEGPGFGQLVKIQKCQHLSGSSLADATPAMAINTSAKLIFRTTVKSSG
jgi:hypothetical protein